VELRPRISLLATLLLLGFLGTGEARTCPPTPELWLKVQKYSKAFGLDPHLVYSLVWRESRFCPDALGAKGEIGLGQVMPSTARFLGIPPQYLWDPDWNLYATAKYLRYLYDRYRDWEKALAAYNAGPGRVDRGGIPQSTQTYVRAIFASYWAVKESQKGVGGGKRR
jgi:soluble lytic murein transglycosylase-like protein